MTGMARAASSYNAFAIATFSCLYLIFAYRLIMEKWKSNRNCVRILRFGFRRAFLFRNFSGHSVPPYVSHHCAKFHGNLPTYRRVIDDQWRRQLWGTGAHALAPRLSTISFLVHFKVNLIANYPSIV